MESLKENANPAEPASPSEGSMVAPARVAVVPTPPTPEDLENELVRAIEKVISLAKGRCKAGAATNTQFSLVFDLDESTVNLLRPTTENITQPPEVNQFAFFAGRAVKILIVEDDDISRVWLKRILKQIPNCEIVEATNGNQAIQLLRTGALPDLCLSDVNMPELDGIQMLQCIRGDQSLKSLDVILCTARNDRESVSKAVALSVTGYLIKPFAATKVIEKVKESLTRSAARNSLATRAA